MQIPIGRRRLVLSLVAAPPRCLDVPEAAGANDRELAALSRPTAEALLRSDVVTQAVLLGIGTR